MATSAIREKYCTARVRGQFDVSVTDVIEQYALADAAIDEKYHDLLLHVLITI